MLFSFLLLLVCVAFGLIFSKPNYDSFKMHMQHAMRSRRKKLLKGRYLSNVMLGGLIDRGLTKSLQLSVEDCMFFSIGVARRAKKKSKKVFLGICTTWIELDTRGDWKELAKSVDTS